MQEDPEKEEGQRKTYGLSTAEDLILDGVERNSLHKNMTDWTCADVGNLKFQGTISDDKNSYFHFHILRCTEERLNMIPGFENSTCASP